MNIGTLFRIGTRAFSIAQDPNIHMLARGAWGGARQLQKMIRKSPDKRDEVTGNQANSANQEGAGRPAIGAGAPARTRAPSPERRTPSPKRKRDASRPVQRAPQGRQRSRPVGGADTSRRKPPSHPTAPPWM